MNVPNCLAEVNDSILHMKGLFTVCAQTVTSSGIFRLLQVLISTAYSVANCKHIQKYA